MGRCAEHTVDCEKQRGQAAASQGTGPNAKSLHQGEGLGGAVVSDPPLMAELCHYVFLLGTVFRELRF